MKLYKAINSLRTVRRRRPDTSPADMLARDYNGETC